MIQHGYYVFVILTSALLKKGLSPIFASFSWLLTILFWSYEWLGKMTISFCGVAITICWTETDL